jgi:hypothetical protein
MIAALVSRSLVLGEISNYPGVFAARWVQYRGIAPSAAIAWGSNIWLVLTRAIEWEAIGLAVSFALRSFLDLRISWGKIPNFTHQLVGETAV